jgi:hypothetical protein
MKMQFSSPFFAMVMLLNYASASPLRVIMLSSGQEVSSPIRFGHAVGLTNPNVAQISAPKDEGKGTRRKHCGGAKFHDKAIEISNTFRQALGLPLIETHIKADTETHDGLIRILPVSLGGATVTGVGEYGSVAHRIHTHHHHHIHAQSFLKRVHQALMALGPWEGRAVAFVLGCGIGVLLRMFWVMTIVCYRMIKGETDEHDYVEIINETSAEEILVPPPHYTYEKGDHVEVVHRVD